MLLVPGRVRADTGIAPPSLFEQGTAFLKAKAYHLALDRFFLAGAMSRDDAERAEALRWTGEAHLRDKQYDSAYHDFLTSLRLDPLSGDAAGTEFKSAVALVYGKKYSESLAHLKHLAQKNTDVQSLSDIYFWQAECDYQMGQYDAALKLYQTILKINPQYPHASLVNYLMDWCSFQLKDFDTAYQGFNDLAANATDKNLAKLSSFQAAESQFWLGHYADAQAAYAQFTKTYAGDDMESAAYYGWGWSLAKQDQHLQAAIIFKKIVTNFSQNALAPWAALREGAEDFVLKNNDLARKAYENGLTLCGGKTPTDFLEYGLGWLDYSEQSYDDAIEKFKNVEKFEPQSDLYWNSVYLRAGCRYLQGKYDDAKKIYAVITDPAPAELIQDATYWNGWCDYAMGQYDAALKEFLFVAQNTQGETQTRGKWGAAESQYQLGQFAKAAENYQHALNSNPPDDLAANCYSGLGWSRFQQEKYSDAIDAFEKAVQKAPDSPIEAEARLRMADSYYNLHNYKKASEIYQKAESENTGKSLLDAQEQLGWCSYRQENFSDAVSLWGDLLKKNCVEDRKSRLLYWSAWAYFRNKDFQNAQLFFQQVVSGYPQDPLAPEALLREGDCFFNQQQFKDSKDAYQRFIDAYPTHALLPDALYGLQWSADKLGLKDEASQAAKNFLQKFPDSAFAPSIQYRLADTFFQNQKYADAIDTYQTLLQKYPNSLEAPKAMFWMATALSKSDKKPEAISAFNDLLKKFPNDPLALEGRFSLGSLYHDSGDFKDALDNYSHIFQTNPTHHLASHALFNGAVCETELGDVPKALEYYEKVISDYPNDPLIADAGIQAGILYEKQKQTDKALQSYEITIKSKNEALAAEASFYHADIHKQAADYAKAIDEFNALTVNYPAQDQWVVTAYAKIAECYEAQKKYQQAADTYQRILKYTKIEVYRKATYKRIKALEPFLHHRKKTAQKSDAAPAVTEANP